MEYRFLGPTGLKVSALSYGTMTFDDFSKEDQYFEIFKKCFDSGINFFDTAESYGKKNSESEIILGHLIKRLNVPRSQLVISTKVFFQSLDVESLGNLDNMKPNTSGLSRKHIIEAIKNSLKRLQLDYVDVFFCHRPDFETPLEETCRAMNWVIEQGLAYYWGTSEWSAERIKEAFGICDRLGLIRPVVEQPQYNMFNRERFEVEYGDLFDNNRHGSTIWSPLAGGMLTGKYVDSIPEDSRAATSPVGKLFFYDTYMSNEEKKIKTNKLIADLKEVADGLGASLAQLAVAWTLANKDVSTCMVGASKISQIEDNLKALELIKKLDKDVLEKIEKILGNRPTPVMNWKLWRNAPPRR